MRRPKFRVESTTAPSEAGEQRRDVPAAWVEVPVDEHWMAAYRVVPGRYREPVIAELRLFPLEEGKGRPPGRWSAEVVGVNAKVPEGGVSADVLRSVRIGDHRLAGRKFRKWLDALPSAHADQRSRAAVPSLLGKGTYTAYTPGRPGRPPKKTDRSLVTLARDYAALVAQGSKRPTGDLADARHLPPGKVRDLLHEARRRELLTFSGQGRAGGQLTLRAQEVLAGKRQKGPASSVAR